jgi:hypothetical protein
MKFINDHMHSRGRGKICVIVPRHLKDLNGIGHELWQLALFHLKVCHISGRDNANSYHSQPLISYHCKNHPHSSVVLLMYGCVVIQLFCCSFPPLLEPFCQGICYFKLTNVNVGFVVCASCHTVFMLQCDAKLWLMAGSGSEPFAFSKIPTLASCPRKLYVFCFCEGNY